MIIVTVTCPHRKPNGRPARNGQRYRIDADAAAGLRDNGFVTFN